MAGGVEVQEATEVFARLKKLSCPSLEGVYVTEPRGIHQLLCTPSAHRLDILEWICARAYPPLQEHFSTLKESQAEVKVKEMAKLGFDLMLCHPEDVDLIKGNVSPSRQLSFMRQLLDIIQTCEEFSNSSELPPLAPGRDKNFITYARENEELLKELFSSPHFQATLAPECNPWPADLKPLLVPEEIQKRTLPCSKDNAIGDHIKELQKLSLNLEDLKQECTFLGSSAPGEETVIQKLRLALTDFHQLIAAFTQVYENDFQEHCGHPAPQMSPAGPLFQSVHQLLTRCCKDLEAIAQFTETSSTIDKVVMKRQQAKECWGGGSMATLCEKIKELKQNYELFQSSLQD
ncbi:HAUS augmin-like complex subunit 7 isoform X2 [Bufo bufo]|uniref:HAUS augmin-like complex subunit 7 isoform X2 n=1 Tax=Bufo bufo TaxID=8384 RepID=UPI001ABDFCDC|nr:HAUS augmin-like complex subunit 7 isoform X2 [Bufo bufo]